MGVSLDGYIAGPYGGFGWTAPHEEVFRFVAEGQPVLLLRNGRPAAAIIDLESWEKSELAAAQPP